MTPATSVVTVTMHSGERMPLLRDTSTGIGLFEPTVYALTLRDGNAAANTIGQALRAVQLLYQILRANDVDLFDRVRANHLLTLGEVEALVEQCKLKKHDLNELHYGPVDEKVARLDIAKLKKGLIAQANLEQVDNNTALIRLTYIKGYLDWFADYADSLRLPSNRKLFLEVAGKTIRAIANRMPAARKPSNENRRRGLTREQELQVLALVKPSAENNPWSTEFVRERNELIVRLLFATGVRKGELLGIKVKDVKFADNTIFIARRADDPEDSRGRQPTTKTYDRELLLGTELADQVKRYLKDVRSSVPGAKRHPYVFVSESGAPMSLSAVDYLFATIRIRLPDIKQLSPHILRHTWNDRFSALVKGRMSKEEEMKVRNYIMGWSETSKQAENYTRRYIEEQAYKLLAEMQQKLFKTRK